MALATQGDDSVLRRLRDGRDELRELQDEAKGIAGDAGNIARDEIRLALSEVREGVRSTLRTTAWAAAAGVLALVTLMWLPVPVYVGLSEGLDAWLAALVTVLILLLTTLIVAFLAVRQLRSIRLTPRAAIARMKEDAQWLKQQLSREAN